MSRPGDRPDAVGNARPLAPVEEALRERWLSLSRGVQGSPFGRKVEPLR